jgi:hypothetical protein
VSRILGEKTGSRNTKRTYRVLKNQPIAITNSQVVAIDRFSKNITEQKIHGKPQKEQGNVID